MPSRARRLYFAYGSNLSLKQMAARCPESYYIGRAVLPDYRWQINQRGFANVIACPGFAVHGLVYELNDDDEARLDRSEGTASGAYAKALLGVVLHPAPRGWQLKTTTAAAEGGLRGWPGGDAERSARVVEGVLVYLSEQFVRRGSPRDEYVDRMNTGMRDAVMLGVPEAYFENVVRASIPDRPVLRRVPTPRVRELPRRPPSRAQSVGERDRVRSVSVEERDRGVWEREELRRRSWTPNFMARLYSGFAEGGDRAYRSERPY
jgi:hypothetical protein